MSGSLSPSLRPMEQPSGLPPQPPSPWLDVALFATALLIVALTGAYLIGDV